VKKDFNKLGEIMSNERVIEFLLTPLMNNYVYYSTEEQKAEIRPQLIDSLHICLTILPVPSSKELKNTRIGKLVNKIAK
jgi:septin family protein